MNQLSSEHLRIHSLIFPVFKHEEAPGSYSARDTTAYREISLKIFKELGLQDLCQAKLVCKEWKQLVEGSFLSEKAYTQALKSTVEKKDPIQESFCIEKLGDIYLRKETTETLLQAAGLYNYALRLAPQEWQKVIKDRLSQVQNFLVKQCKGRPFDPVVVEKQFENNRKVLKKFREEIGEKIQKLPETPSSQEVRDLYAEIARQIKIFFGQLAIQAFDNLGPAPCEYAMIGFGSLAREEMTPYSDLEFGILIEEDTSVNREYFKCFTILLHLHVINLGETILPALNIPCLKAINFFDGLTPRGFAFDGAGVEGKGCKTPLGNGKTFELIQTPEKMAQYVGKDENGKWWHEKEPHLPMELLNFTHLLGNLQLTKAYDEKIQEILNTNTYYQENLDLRQYLAKQHLVLADMIAFSPGMGDLGRNGMLFQAKNDFYRFPHLALGRLALLKKIVASNTFTRIDKLRELNILKKEAAEKLKDWMSLALFMRLKTYSHYQAQQEMMNPLLKPFGFDDHELTKKQFALDHKALKKIKKIYQVFIPFYQAVKEFLVGNEAKLKSSDLEDNSPQTQGDILRRLFQHKRAEKWYLRAKVANPQNSEVLNALGIIYHKQGNLVQAAKHSNKALTIDLKLYGKNYPQVARDYSSLGLINQEQSNLGKAVKYSRKALVIDLKLFGENHPLVAIDYSNLGAIYNAQGNLDKAFEYSNKALGINLNLFGENHPIVATCYSNLGKMHNGRGNLNKALEYSNKALTIDLKLFGEKHHNVAIRYSNLATIYHSQGYLDKAAECSRRARAINLKFFGENHSTIANDYNNLGQFYQEQDNLEKAAEYTIKALVIDFKLYGDNHPKVASCYSNLGQIYQAQGNLEKAAEYSSKALAIDLKLLGENHPQVASCYINLGQIYQAQGNLDKAFEYSNKALTIDLKLFGETHPTVALDYNNLGAIYQAQGKLDKALEYITRALIINLSLYGEDHPTVASRHNNLAAIYQAQGKLDKALEYSTKALAINLGFYGENHSKVANCYTNLAAIYQEQGKLDKALEYSIKALTINLRLFGENYPKVATDYSNLGAIYQAQGNLNKAFEFINKALDIDLKLFGENYPKVATDYSNLGAIYHDQGSLDKAEECSNKALDIDLKLFGENHPLVAIDYSNLGVIYQAQLNLDKAAEYSTKALAINLKLLGENHPNIAIFYNNLGRIYQQQGNFNKAFKHMSKALELSYRLYGRGHPTVTTFCNNLLDLFLEAYSTHPRQK
ncbi:tetratricopeptide repeat protein [Neochlamydia sp. AcF84]|uniref:tetratricopeptide repeat protein n=1 Tax=Neochlamydia sp. AcF84 TaxID=2315858 RepID=UPI0014078F3B|nr:tetratricopeptide repeat protein [Neochlamydia sp. AcF84]